MFNIEIMKKIGSCLFLFILCFGLIGCAYAGEIGIDKKNNEKSLGSAIQAPTINTAMDNNDSDDDDDDDDDSDDWDDDSDDDDDWDDDDDDSDDWDDEEDEFIPTCYHWEWKEYTYCIDLDYNLTDEELTELFTKRDDLREEIANLRLMIENMELSRSDNILLAIDELFEAINKITNNSEFNELLLSLKDINITELNSSFNDLKSLLESIKAEYPDEDFSEIDLLMANLETLLNDELEGYENFTIALKDKIVELYELYEKYPFLGQDVFNSNCSLGKKMYTVYDTSPTSAAGSEYSSNSKNSNNNNSTNSTNSTNINNVFAEMRITGMPYLVLVILVLLSLIGLRVKRKF